MILFPAIDLKDGVCVRLKLGDMEQATVYNADPAAQAKAFEDQGFEWLHVVDLNGAFAGKSVNGEAVEAILKTTSNPVQLELVWQTLKTLMHPEAVGRQPALDARTREIIALAVSATNGCAYCVNSHTAALRKLGLPVEAVGEVLAIASLFNMTNTLADGYQVEPDFFPPLDA